MLRAITASTGAIGTLSQPRVAAARVMLCASVNAVIVATRRLGPSTKRSSASTKSRWSTPPRMCSTPNAK